MMYALQYSSGPLPAPAVLEHYDQIVPGGADRIMGWAEKQADHRQSMEKMRLTADIRFEGRGQIFAFAITVLTILAGSGLIYLGRDTMGLSLILGELALVAGIFVYNRVSQAKELRQKMRDLLEADQETEREE